MSDYVCMKKDELDLKLKTAALKTIDNLIFGCSDTPEQKVTGVKSVIVMMSRIANEFSEDKEADQS